jgi:uncharacterized protein YecT (DUF1311 family)
MKHYLIAGAALLLSANALADECANASTQLELNTCTAQQYQAADKKLNQTYQAAIKRAAAPQRDLLKKHSRRGSPCVMRTVRLWVPEPKAAAFSR